MVLTRRAAAAAAAGNAAAPPASRRRQTDKNDAVSHQKQNTNPNNSGLKQMLLLAALATGICTCYLGYGLVQERLFSPSSPHGRAVRAVGPITTFLVMSQAVGNTVVALVWTWIQNNLLGCSKQPPSSTNDDGRNDHNEHKQSSPSVLNYRLLLLTAFCYFGAMSASNESINWVSYPTVVLAKSSKLIPAMLAGVLLERKSYSAREWAGALLITSGIVIFNYTRLQQQADGSSSSSSSSAKPDSPFGLVLLAISLTFDGALSACQGSIKKSSGLYRPPTAMEFMAFTNAFSCLFLLPACILSGQLQNGTSILFGSGAGDGSEGDVAAARKWILLLNATAAAGQVFIFLTIHYFSSIMCTTITTTRKFVSILLSVRHFGHVFSPIQWISVVMVFGGLYMEIVAKVGGDGSSNGGREGENDDKKNK